MRYALCLASLALSACFGQERPVPEDTSQETATAAAASQDSVLAGDSILVGDPPTLVPGPLGRLPRDWTVNTADVPSAREGAATLLSVRTGTHDGFDRVAFTFDGDTLPGVYVEYVDLPATPCAGEESVRVEGEGALEVRFMPANAHTEAGEVTVAERRQAPALPALRELVLTCDFEADVSWVLGLAAPAGYRTAVLSDPLRLVVDVRHGR